MVRKVGGSGAGEFSIGSGDEQPFQIEARHVKEAKKNFQGDSLQGETLQGRVNDRFTDPSNINGRLFHND
ncbi:MAG: hypothetical protein H7A38_02750 [Chlamydiales bacterium]|nr:hypothetical protein [Chlamydiales bacterium]